MADGKLIFPIKFDLQSAVREASGDIDAVLRRMQTQINSKPLKFSIDGGFSNMGVVGGLRDSLEALDRARQKLAKDGSIEAMRKEMRALIIEWEKLSEAERTATDAYGKFTGRAGEIVKRFAELTAAANTHARSLDQLISASDKATAAQEKLAQKRAETATRLAGLKNPDMDSLTEVKASLKYYEQLGQSVRQQGSGWDYITDKIIRLKDRVAELTAKYKETTTRHALDLPEGNLTQVRDKIKALQIQLDGYKPNDAVYKTFADNIARLREEEIKLTAAKKEATKTELELQAARDKRQKKQLESEWNAAADKHRKEQAAEEKRILEENLRIKKEAEAAAIRERDRIIEMNQALVKYRDAQREKKRLADEDYQNLVKQLQEENRIAIEKAKSAKAEREKAEAAKLAAEAEARRQEKADRYARLQREVAILQGEEKTLDQINAKLRIRNEWLSRSTRGSGSYTKNLEEVIRLSRELERANQLMADFRQKSFEGLDSKMTQAQVQALQGYRVQLENLNTQYNTLNANKQAFDSNGNLTAAAVSILQQRADVLSKIAGVTRDADSAQDAYKKKIADEKKELNRLVEAEARRNKHLQDAARAMQASERRIDGLNTKLQRYQQLIGGLTIGSDKWNAAAAEIKRLTEELDRATQRMRDFQNAAFKGLPAGLTANMVNWLSQKRAELDEIDRRFNQLYQNGRATNADGSYNRQALAILDERIAKEKEINKILTTAADAAVKRQQELNALAEQRIRKEKEHDQAKGERRALAIAEQRRKAAGGLTKEQEKRQRLLNLEENTVNNIQRKLAYYQSKLNGQTLDSKGFERTAKEIERLTRLLDEARRKIADMTGQSTSGASKQAANARKVNEEYSKQLTYIDRLVRRMAVYASIGMVGNFLTKVREVTAQFELQRISLGAIIQDQNRANQLFSEIKSFALKSPVSILDLTKYTKQLAAYKVGWDGVKTDTKELFDWTKRLTDVSVGLGVSMDRVVLAFGQVRATGHLRASEIRQFTEMGVPIVEELAAKLTKMNGELVTAAQVMDMVSKRAISFDMVKEVFNDMTSAGGIFYNMQEKQGNTLYGLWAKLGDAASVMYDEIGNTGVVNSGMKSLISSMTWLMKNWRGVAGEVAVAAAGFGAYKLVQKLTTINTIAQSKATRDLARAETELTLAKNAGNKAQIKASNYRRIAAMQDVMATQSTNMLTSAKYRLLAVQNRLKAAMVGNWITLAITAFAALTVAIAAAWEKSTRLARELAKIKEETSVLQSQSVRNFDYLLQEATKSSDGSKRQKDALDELNRTYGEILPAESLRIESLRKMVHQNGEIYDSNGLVTNSYKEMADAIREYIAAEQETKSINTINETENAVQVDMQKKLREAMTDKDLGTLALSESEVTRFFIAFQKTSQDASKTVKEQFIEAFRQAGLHGAEEMWDEVKGQGAYWYDWNPFAKMAGDDNDLDYYVKHSSAIGELSRSFREQEERIKGVREGYEQMTADLGVYTNAMIAYNQKVDSLMNSGETYLQDRQNVNTQILEMEKVIRAGLAGVGITWKEEWAKMVTSIDPNDLNKTSTLNMEAIIAAIDPNKYPELHKFISEYKKIYDGLIPSDPTVQQIRAKMIAVSDSFKISMDTMRRFLWDGKTSVDEHLKFLNDQIEQYEASLKKMQTTLTNSGIFGTIASFFLKGKIEETTKIIKALKEQAAFVKTYTVPEKDKNKGRKSDTRLQELQEINQTLEKINKSYDELSKKEGKSKALDDIKKQFEDTLKYTNKLGKKFGLHFDYPTEFKSLQEYRREILKVMKSLKNLKGGEKAILEFQTMIDKADSDELQKQIEKQLKDIAERISRAKVADDFYRKILTTTGDYSLAAQVAESIFGQDGRKLKSIMAEQVRNLTNGLVLPDGIISPDNIINHKRLREWAESNKDELGEMYKELVKISEQGQKDLAKSYEGYLKDLEKAKSYADKRVELARTTAEKIREIEQDPQLSRNIKDELVAGYRKREAEEAAKLEYEAFKNTPIYVQMFEDLDNASTMMLRNMRTMLNRLKGKWGETLDPTQLKEMQSRLSEIGEVLARRNPFKAIAGGISKMRELRKEYGSLKDVERKLAEQTAQLLNYKEELTTALQSEAAARSEYDRVVAESGAESDAAKDARTQLAVARQLVEIKRKSVDLTEEEVALLEKIIGEYKESNKEIDDGFNGISEYVQKVKEAQDAIKGAVEEWSALGDDEMWNTIFDGLDKMAQSAEQGGEAVAAYFQGDYFTMVTKGISAVANLAAGIGKLFWGSKVAKANKEIERQQKLLDQLEYSFDRTQKAADKAFGTDYVRNLNKQYSLLLAQQQAYKKQYEAEISKGKKADEEKAKDYLDKARDIADEIADMEGQVAERMLGTDLTSAARDFAQAWLDAYKEFGNTADAMSEKFHEMIENMLVESIMAKAMQRALEPTFKMIDEMEDDDFYNRDFWKSVMKSAEKGAKDADAAGKIIMDFAKEFGYNARSQSGEFSGIAKSISGATSEEINSAAAIGNTLMYYVSPIPRMDENLARVVAIMESGGATIPQSGSMSGAVDYTGLLTTANQHLSSLPRMEQHLADIHTILGRIIKTKGSISGVNTFLNQ